MPAAAPNHRLLAREHLAEAAACADEGDRAQWRAYLAAAAGHAIGQLAADHRLDAASPPRALAILTLRGVLPFDARPLWSALQHDGDAERPGHPAAGLDDEQAMRAVQALVDLAAGVPGPHVHPARWQRWGAPADDEGDDRDGEPLPLRATGWVRAATRDRARRRMRRARTITATAAFVLGLGVLGFAWSDSVQGTEYRPPKADIGFFDSGS